VAADAGLGSRGARIVLLVAFWNESIPSSLPWTVVSFMCHNFFSVFDCKDYFSVSFVKGWMTESLLIKLLPLKSAQYGCS
jgi:hypothetical protein